MGKDNRLAITEYGFFTTDISCDNPFGTILEQNDFDLLENFAIESKRITSSGELYEYFFIEQHEKYGKIIKPGNFSGVISLNDGTQVEVFCGIRSRYVLLQMLNTVENLPVTKLSQSVLKRGGLNIFEMFVLMFINQMFIIMKNGLKQTYVPVRGNERFVKGKTVYSQHATKNFAHKERFFVEYDDFSINRVENQILKATSKLLYKMSLNGHNKSQLNTILNVLEDVDMPSNIKADFKRVATDRSMDLYHEALDWSRIFLLKKSSFFFSSRNSGYAVLFPMNRLFQSYISKKLEDNMKAPEFSFRLLNKSIHQFDQLSKYINLLPDIIFGTGDTGKFTVIDIRWGKKEKKLYNLLDDFDKTVGELYADASQFNASRVIVIYPQSDQFNEDMDDMKFISQNGAPVEIKFFKLNNLDQEISALVDYFKENKI